MFDRFDICEAWYMFATLYHEGQWSTEYQIFGRLDTLGFQPSILISEETLSDNAREMLAELVARKERGERVVRER